VRQFVEKELAPFISDWEEEGNFPLSICRKAYEAGIYAAMFPPEFGGTPPSGGKYDAFHHLIYCQELSRGGSGGVLAAGFFTIHIGLPPILALGSEELKSRVVRDIVEARKMISLAITEPYGGSDVASIRCTAVRDGERS